MTNMILKKEGSYDLMQSKAKPGHINDKGQTKK